MHGASQDRFAGLPPIDPSALSPHDGPGLFIPPITPISPVDPSAPQSPVTDGKPRKKVNPLSDLIETEKVYVDLLTGIMRKVASAWSRQNLPPPELDTMFRSVEGIYKANRSLLTKLKEIGTNPSSPKALGDLLMRWIEDLEAPYTKYSETFVSGFDDWEPVRSNERLPTTLAMFSSSNPPPLPPSSPQHPPSPPLWSLDELFLLPKGRLRYYRKLYSRLLKSTTPGRSDHRLLTGALEKLDRLLSVIDQRAIHKVWGESVPPSEPTPLSPEDEVVIDLRTRDSTLPPLDTPSNRESDSTQATDSRSVSIASQDTTASSVENDFLAGSSAPLPVNDLERRLSTERTLDIFTMQPKQVKLQISPPNLHYTREIFASVDVFMQVTPRSTGIEVSQARGRVYLLTDLLLMCERMLPHEVAERGPGGPEMWLLYPPLAGKHLRVEEVEGSATAIAVTILRKETVFMHTKSWQDRDRLLHEFRECIERASTIVPTKNQQPPPPVPKLPDQGNMFQSNQSFASGPQSRPFSPSNTMPPHHHSGERVQSPPVDDMARMNVGGPYGSGGPQGHPGQPPHPGGGQYPPRSSSTGQPGPSFGPGQVMPPGPGQYMPPRSPGPPQRMPSGHAHPQYMPPPGPGQMMPPNGPGPGQVMGPGPGGPMFAPGQIVPPPRGTSQRAPSVPPPQGHLGAQYPPSSSSRAASPWGPPGSRPASDRSSGSIRKSSSSHSLASEFERRQHSMHGQYPPMPGMPDDLAPPNRPFISRSGSSSSLSSMGGTPLKLALPSAQYSIKSSSSFADPSPPTSPIEETPKPTGPTTSSVTAQMKCKVFLQEHHAKWKSLGSAKLMLYHESPTNIKQLVVQADSSKKNVLISTLVFEDGVERVGKCGVAVNLSDKGVRTGVVYMIQTKNEKDASTLFNALLAGSDRSEVRT
ncbi:RhoGEF domain-containing protein [Phanerochaete sordida]|uniref:RhoGEF domain-containing protein n=1 Tax=Phanerochaete sordida TaxID=48140 RepID=A0A9P3LBA6_9APHY|nr:RhoGEF domain-containing protein [Phanerochaete sordida]